MGYLGQIGVEGHGIRGTLFVTDETDAAKRLREQGEAVLIWLHEGNREQDFSGFRFAVEDPEDVGADYAEKVYRRCKGLPWIVLETKRCLVRETVPEDVEAFYEIYSNPAMTKFMEGLYPDKEQEKAYVRDYIEKVYGFYGFGVWTVVEKETGAVIGRAGFSYREGCETPELGFLIGVPWQGQGYAREACGAILDYGWKELGFQAVQALVETGNEASLRLCDGLGFRAEQEVSFNGREYFLLKRYK